MKKPSPKNLVTVAPDWAVVAKVGLDGCWSNDPWGNARELVEALCSHVHQLDLDWEMKVLALIAALGFRALAYVVGEAYEKGELSRVTPEELLDRAIEVEAESKAVVNFKGCSAPYKLRRSPRGGVPGEQRGVERVAPGVQGEGCISAVRREVAGGRVGMVRMGRQSIRRV